MSKLKKLRKTHGYTQGEIAEKIGVSRPTYTVIESGGRELKESHIAVLADLYSMTPDEIIRREEIEHYENIIRRHKLSELKEIVESEEKAEEIYDKYIT